jgi:hypothetical protein|nr:MAG TPA: Terminase [Caudoviricetes sp.]
MLKNIKLSKTEYFTYEMLREYESKGNYTVVSLTGARGAGKTESLRKMIQKRFAKGEIALYLRNSQNDLASARQYFSILSEIAGEDFYIGLGQLGAGTICLCHTVDEPILIGYTLAIGQYDRIKSSKKKVDYVIYEEFTNLNQSHGLNRAFGFVEILETVRQTCPNITVYACANNLVRDTLFEWLFDEKDLLEIAITKPERISKSNYKSKTIETYLQGGILIDTPEFSVKDYHCQGYIKLGTDKIFLYENKMLYPQYIIASKGTQKEIKKDISLLNILRVAVYQNLETRNKLEFPIGLFIQSYQSLLT